MINLFYVLSKGKYVTGGAAIYQNASKLTELQFSYMLLLIYILYYNLFMKQTYSFNGNNYFFFKILFGREYFTFNSFYMKLRNFCTKLKHRNRENALKQRFMNSRIFIIYLIKYICVLKSKERKTINLPVHTIIIVIKK